MASKGPRPACVEDYDEEQHAILPDTRLSARIAANTAAKISSRLEKFQEPLIDAASDSGYSSRTAATVNSTQSGPSGGKSPPIPHKLDTPKRTDLARKSSTRERKEKERSRPSREEEMVGAYAGAAHHAHVPRSSSKSHRRESSARQYHDNYHDYGIPQYHQSAPMEHRQSEYVYYPQRPPVPEYSPSPHTARYPAGVIENIHVNNPGRPSRSSSYHTYHPNGRPMSFQGVPHGMGSGMASSVYSQHTYEHGPPPANSAYMHQYSSSPYGQPSYYPPPASDYPSSEYARERSESREPRPRSSSIYAPPPAPMDAGQYEWYDNDPMEHYSSREVYDRPTRHQDQDEDYYRMLPPPRPKPRAAPQIHQAKRPERPERPDLPRKMHTSAGIVSSRRPSRGMERERGMDRDIDRMDMPELASALPAIQDRGHRRISREVPFPERTHSLRDNRRSTPYHDDLRNTQVAVASSRQRKSSEYHYDERSSVGGDLEDREREAENYQAVRSGRASTAALPLSAETLLPKASQGNGSESGSQKSRSSRGSATASRKEDDKNMTLMLNGFQIGFTSESVAGKSINIRAGETGAVRLNIGGPRPSKQHVNSASSDHTGGSSRRALEDGARRPRDDKRLERSNRRDSQSAYGARHH